jgi:hypothetical protein
MAPNVAPFHRIPLAGEINRSPVGGCWIAGSNSDHGTLPSLTGGDPTGNAPGSANRPPLFYPQGYWLPPGTTEYAKLWSETTHGRIIEYVPLEYVPRAVRRIQERLNAALAAGIRPGEPGYPSEAEIARMQRSGQLMGWEKGLGAVPLDLMGNPIGPLAVTVGPGLRPNEEYIGRIAIVIYAVGTPPLLRRRQTQKLWEDIERLTGKSP